jgi:hypothetical protein
MATGKMPRWGAFTGRSPARSWLIDRLYAGNGKRGPAPKDVANKHALETRDPRIALK